MVSKHKSSDAGIMPMLPLSGKVCMHGKSQYRGDQYYLWFQTSAGVLDVSPTDKEGLLYQKIGENTERNVTMLTTNSECRAL